MLKLNNNYLCALDIGSSKIAACVARLKKGRIAELFFENTAAKGMRKGLIVDAAALVDSISKLMKKLKAKSGIKIKFISTNISGPDITTKHSRAIIPLAERGNKVITAQDIQGVIEQARILGSSLEEEIIQMMPYSYSIDSKSNVLNPLGLYSHRLEVDLYLICAKLASVQTLSRVINQAGYEIKDLFLSGLATSQAVLNPELKVGLNLFCDIGSDITELLVFKDGSLRDLEILPLGGDDLTGQLQKDLKVPFDLAEDIKRSYGIITDLQQIKDDKEILVKRSELYKPIKQKLVCEIIASSAKTLCSKIKDAATKKASLYEVDNLIITGRTLLIDGFIETLENILATPVKVGRINNPQILSLAKEENSLTGQKYLTYLTALGMIVAALEEKTGKVPAVSPAAKNPVLKAINRFKEIYQEYF